MFTEMVAVGQEIHKDQFSSFFTDECHATLGGVLDGWRMATTSQQGCTINKEVASHVLGQNHGERAGTGPFRVPEGVKMTMAKYIEFLTDHDWYKCHTYI